MDWAVFIYVVAEVCVGVVALAVFFAWLVDLDDPKSCGVCGEVTNLYRPVGQSKWYCHTCIATGRVSL